MTGFDSLSSSPLTRLPSLSILPQMTVTAFSMPRFRAIGLAPAATVLTPSRKMAWARTVAVVVPSPATSDVLEATSRTICAPMFSSGVAQFDFLGYGDAVFGDGRRTEFLFDDYVAALGAEGDLHGIGQKVDAAEDRLTGFFSVNDLFCHCVYLLISSVCRTGLRIVSNCCS